MTIGYWLLLVAVTYGAVLFVVFAGLRVASAADQAADRALLAMLDHRRRIRKALPRIDAPARAARRRRVTTPHSLANSYR